MQGPQGGQFVDEVVVLALPVVVVFSEGGCADVLGGQVKVMLLKR